MITFFVLLLIFSGLAGAGLGYAALPALSDVLGVPLAFWQAHPWYQRIAAIIGATLGVIAALQLDYNT